MNIRLRQDLEITQRLGKLEAVWILKDPVSFSHFQFSEEEFVLAKLLKPGRSVEQVVRKWQDRFKTTSLTIGQVQSFVQRLIADNLVVVDRAGYGGALNRSGQRLKGGGVASWFRNPLAIRFRGINPNALLGEFDWLGRVFFHPTIIVVNLIAAISVLLFLLANFESVAQRIPRIDQILATRGVIGLIVTMVVVKVLHELGHAMACRRFGAECLEIGVMLLAFIPTLYCNVSDAWSVNERWKRMMVSFAGMYVEICLAAIAAVAWFFTTPDTLASALLFNVIVLCSISTLLVNGNPLLRYDGYYLLSDWLERPNLSQAANSELSGFVRTMVGGSNVDSNFQNSREPAEARWLLLYACLSFLYRWFVVGLILCTLFLFAQSWQASMLGGILVVGLFFAITVGRLKGGRAQISDGTISWMRLAVFSLVSLALLGFVVLLPLPKNVYGDLEVRLKDSTPVYSPLDGRLVFIAKPYQRVTKGARLARVVNSQLSNQVDLKKLELERARNELKVLSSRANEEGSVAAKIEMAQKNVDGIEASLELMKSELSRSNIIASVGGLVFPAAKLGDSRSETPSANIQEPLSSARNKDCFVRASEHLLTIGDPDSKFVVILVKENDMEFVEAGQHVRLKYDRITDRHFEGEVEKIFETELNNGLKEAENEKSFRVIVATDELPKSVVAGAEGKAKISVLPESLGGRMLRFFKRALTNRL